MSAMANLAGMFPGASAGKDYPHPNDEPLWPERWIPIPVHTVSLKYDHVCMHICICAFLMPLSTLVLNEGTDI